MKYTIQNSANTPSYLQIYNQIRDDILNGIYPFGSKLPSKRVLASEIGVSIITIEHAYSLLFDEGYIEPRERSGYFVVFSRDDGFVSTPSRVHKSVIPTHIATTDTPEFPFSVLTKTMRRVMSDYDKAILERSPNSGCAILRESIRDYLNVSRGICVDTEQIIVGSGSEYLYNLIVALLGRDKLYAIESPSYKKIEQVYRASNVKLEMLPLGNDGIESADLWSSKADVLHISPYRSFPSGVTATASKRHEYVRWVGKEKFIVEDDFESEFSVSKKPEETLFSLSPENVIYVNTFSKTISPSLRVGYMVIPKCLLEKFDEQVGFYSCTVPTFVQYVLAELISNGDFSRHINRVRRNKRKMLASE